MPRDLKKGVQVRVLPDHRARPAVAALRGQLATVLSWSQAENCYRIELQNGEQRILHRLDLEAVT
ncbi:hypothetical protein QR90_06665 [Deinococcus radiopugnans]|uniref:Uncharacterized protein n=1 Tax=Deinococcus radiopugnans TaxID=57497 RepID=A0A0A7KFB2_9DEIO|nr:hypothetical protein [Deinococcus radiopugnans]AIZ44852.1 hypothetical protein QR90_06665 [Deinococcus radiopugnans]QLG11020.1 hypothetical protein HLB42_09720 [Deinococcus sp. D7000]